MEFDVYGPVTDERYWRRCQAEMAGDARVRYCGALEHDAVPRTFARYDLLLLPTRGESFGHVILEALAAGCPVLVSDRTPWRGLESRRAGWDVSLAEPGAFAACVRRIIGMDEQEHRGWVAGARAAARDWMHDASGIDAHLRMFETVARRPAAGPEAGQADAGECTM